MGQWSAEIPFSQNTRRWPRYPVNLPVRIVAINGILTTPVSARGSEISRAGMAVCATTALKPGDLMQLQFPISGPSRVAAVVRNRNGDCLGLEFLTQLPPDNEAMEGDDILLTDPVPGGPPELRESTLQKSTRASCDPQTVSAGLQRKQREMKQIQREIEALKIAILLLADDENRLSRLSPPGRPQPDARPWPLRS
jgi:PilZ domain-containing protein